MKPDAKRLGLWLAVVFIFLLPVPAQRVFAVDCPQTAQLANKFSCTENHYHRVIKKSIPGDYSEEIAKLGCKNPNIC